MNLPPIELSTGRKIGPGHPCFIAAEIGQNHNGDVYTATRLMTAAADAGCDAVKFCKRHVRRDLTAAARAEPYHGPQSYGATYGEHREALELSLREYAHLQRRLSYNRWSLVMFATVCDIPSVRAIESTLDPPLWKIASRDLDNLPLIGWPASAGKPIVLSTGMATSDDEIAAAVETVRRYHDKIIVCHCVSEYPTPDAHARLGRLAEIRERFNVHVGYSDHTIGLHFAQAAVALGAVYIEKHITLARADKGTDHACSLEPDALKKLVRNIRSIEHAMRHKDLPEDAIEEIQRMRAKLGRSIVLTEPVAAGETIEEANMVLKCPGTGYRWARRDELIGKRAKVDIPADVTVTPEMIAEEVSCDKHPIPKGVK